MNGDWNTSVYVHFINDERDLAIDLKNY